MTVVFFNQPWRERQLQPGSQVALFGKADTYRGGLQMTNPVVDMIGDRTGRIVPIYPQSEKAQLTTWEIAGWVENALAQRCGRGASPTRCRRRSARRYGLIDRGAALRSIHVPETMAEEGSARRRLAFDELLRVQLVLVVRKRAYGARVARHPPRRQGRRAVVGGAVPLVAAVPAHRRAAAGDRRDRPRPRRPAPDAPAAAGRRRQWQDGRRRHRRCCTAVQGGHQGALMAPTEVLAEQHAAAVRSMLTGVTVPDPGNLFGDRPLRVELLTNRVTGSERRDGARRPRRRLGRPRHRHARADPGGRRVRQPRRGRRRRAAPLRRRAARGAAGQGSGRWHRRGGHRARRAGDDGDADPAHGGDDGLRRPRRERARRAAAGPHADPDPVGQRAVAGGGGVGRRARRGGRRPPGVRGVPADRREREAGGRLGGGDVRAALERRAVGPAARPAARTPAGQREGGGDGPLPAAASSTCSSPRPSSRSASTSPTRR